MEPIAKYKALQKEVEEIDGKGIITMYVNAYNNVDSDGDVSLPGSFNRTIKNNFDRIKHLFNHNRSEIVGLPISFKSDDFGLKVVSQLNLNTAAGKDLFANYIFFKENNRTLEHSIGAQAIDYKYSDENGRQYGIDVKEWKLMEYSTVAFGANELTPVIDIKNEMDVQKALSIVEKLSKMPYSDETKQTIEKFFNAIVQFQQDGSPVFGSHTAPDNTAPDKAKQKSNDSEILKLLRTINI